MAKITMFNGGINFATAPHLIRENEGVFYDNIDHVPGTLKPLKDKESAVPDAHRYGHFFTTESKWYWADSPRSWVEFQERLYIGNPFGVSTKVINGEETNLGIAGPTVIPTVVGTSFALAELTEISMFALGTLTGNPPGDIPDDLDLEYRFVNENADGDLSAAVDIIEVKTGTLGPNAVYITIADENWTENVHVYRRHNGDWRLMLTVPFDPLLDFDKQPLILDVVYDISANAILDENTLSQVGVLNGTLQYAVTFYNSTLGTESVPVITEEVDITNGIVQISNIEVATDPQTNKKRIYRIGGNLTAFHLVATINNVVTTYTDEIADLDLSGELLTSGTNFPPPASGMKWLTESYAMLFAAKKDKLIFTPIGQPDYWPQTFFLDFPAPITGIGKTPAGLLVFTELETFLVTGQGPLALAQQLLSGSQGCINGYTVVNVQGAAYWASTDGICISEGGRIKLYTRSKLGKQNFKNSVNAVVYDQDYYILTEDNGTTFILDTERNVIKTARYDIRSFIVAQDRLYGFKNNALHEIGGLEFTNLSMTYVSPAFIGAGLTIQKVYKNIYINCEGEIDVEVYIDLELVQKVQFTEKDNFQIKVPSTATRGFQIAFAIRGTGTVYELSWSDGNASQ